jgi:hypothetical protein
MAITIISGGAGGGGNGNYHHNFCRLGGGPTKVTDSWGIFIGYEEPTKVSPKPTKNHFSISIGLTSVSPCPTEVSLFTAVSAAEGKKII